MSDSDGEISCLPVGGGEYIDYFGVLLTLKVRSHQTAGAFAIIEAEFPGLSGPPKMHIHPASETFRVLSGKFEFHAVKDGKVVVFSAEPGSVVHVPGGEPHLFRNVNKSSGVLEVVLCPGSMEGYFITLGNPVRERFTVAAMSPPLDLQKVQAVGKHYGIEFFDA